MDHFAIYTSVMLQAAAGDGGDSLVLQLLRQRREPGQLRATAASRAAGGGGACGWLGAVFKYMQYHSLSSTLSFHLSSPL
jgi:hypothetical protein